MSFRVRSRHKARHGPCNTEINFVVLHRFIYHCSQYIVSVFFHSIIFTFLSVPISFPLRLPRYQSISLFVSFYLSLSLPLSLPRQQFSSLFCSFYLLNLPLSLSPVNLAFSPVTYRYAFVFIFAPFLSLWLLSLYLPPLSL